MPINRRVALKAHESDIRRWVDEGKSDEWIASALGTSPSSIQSFRSRRTIRRRPTRAAKFLPKVEDYRSYEGVLEKVGEAAGAGGRAWRSGSTRRSKTTLLTNSTGEKLGRLRYI